DIGETPAGEGRMLRRDGSVFVLEAEAIRLDFDGKPSNVVIGRDVTERRQMLARMAMADRMLSVGTLAAGVAHEINNPLAYIGANLEILSAELENLLATGHSRLPASDVRSLAADARDGVARASAIVRDLRTLSRTDDGEARGPADVTEVLATSIKPASNEIRHRARIVCSYDDNLPAVYAQASRLGQVFLNLLVNAAQAIDAGRADENEIRVRARRDPDRVRVEIEDTGVGIPASIIRRIFDPFFTTKEPGFGVGLGLSISHEIVRAMSGELAEESEPGRGHPSRIRLRVQSGMEGQRAATAAAKRARAARILLIDDEAALGRSLRSLLAPHDEVVPVTRARDALDRLERGESFDVIVCDLMMPEISGIELYERLGQVAPAYTDRSEEHTSEL